MKKFLSILLLVAVMAVSSEACIFTTKQHIILVRNMTTSKVPVKVHCHSDQDDFDEQWLHGSERFERTFCENVFWRSTKFTCTVWWDEEIREFAAFDEKTDYKTKLMIWFIREDGIYNTHDWATPAVKKYDWYDDTGGKSQIH